MKLGRAQLLLLFLFLAFFSLSFLCIALPFVKGEIYGNELKDGLIAVTTAYSPHLSVILGGIFASRGPKRSSQLGRGKGLPVGFWAAVLVSLLWNLLLTWRLLAFALTSNDSISALISYIEDFAPTSTFLIAGVLTYFFAKEG